MDNQATIGLLSDAELDEVTGGRPGGGGGGREIIVEVVQISIGEIVAAASGNSTVTVNVVGIGGNTATNAYFGGHHHR